MVIFKYKQKKFEDDLKIRFYDDKTISHRTCRIAGSQI